MMKKATCKLLAGVMALTMCLAFSPVVVKADDASDSFAATSLTAAADKEAMAEGPVSEGSMFTVFGTVTKRTASDGSVSSVEVAKNGTGGIEFTLAADAAVAVVFSSTGGSNTSTVGIWDSSNALVANNEGIATVTGASAGKTTLTYNLPAGTYKVVSPDATEFDRGARVYTIDITMSAAPAETAAETPATEAPAAPAEPAPTEAATAAPAPTEAPAATAVNTADTAPIAFLFAALVISGGVMAVTRKRENA